MDNSDNQNGGEKGRMGRWVRKGVEKERREDRK
jgi:hypothetical protein